MNNVANVGRLCLDRTETLEQRSSRRHAVGEGSGLVRVLFGRHSGAPVPSSSLLLRPQEQHTPRSPSGLDPCVWPPLGPRVVGD